MPYFAERSSVARLVKAERSASPLGINGPVEVDQMPL
jgi:hypothetical protein